MTDERARHTLRPSSPAKAGDPVFQRPENKSRSRGVLDRPIKPDDDSSLLGSEAKKQSINVIVRHWVGAGRRPMTGSSGRPSIPETLMIESKGRGVLDRPVEPDDDSSFSSSDLSAVAQRAKAEATKQLHTGSYTDYKLVMKSV
jgi:hypothetical protein